MNGQVVNYSAIARDVGADVTTVQSYYQILEDTLLAITIEPFHESIRKRQAQKPKYYLFDLGVTRALTQSLTVSLQPKTYPYGRAFEHFIVAEIYRLQAYKELDFRLSYLRTKDNLEIDLIIERPGRPRALIEIKSTQLIREEDVTALNSIASDIANQEAFCFSQDPTPKQFKAVRAIHWQDGLRELGLL
jgi:predicted AAA+ superfamily ATPase